MVPRWVGWDVPPGEISTASTHNGPGARPTSPGCFQRDATQSSGQFNGNRSNTMQLLVSTSPVQLTQKAFRTSPLRYVTLATFSKLTVSSRSPFRPIGSQSDVTLILNQSHECISPLPSPRGSCRTKKLHLNAPRGTTQNATGVVVTTRASKHSGVRQKHFHATLPSPRHLDDSDEMKMKNEKESPARINWFLSCFPDSRLRLRFPSDEPPI
ncbi:hypothetical protein EYF80_062551 [Liparis tanakae]|uniref:Uncharacterized protein n=1 Tax=Liparis tanakae TaxID=230148 RepID=A0A4Z2EF25_9TELE|nr:hypothetical protein EYF80_062551 [Liparis tanakae]